MHAGDTTNNICMGNNFPGTVQQLINMTITTTSWSTQAGPTRVRSKRLAKFTAKYRTPARSR